MITPITQNETSALYKFEFEDCVRVVSFTGNDFCDDSTNFEDRASAEYERWIAWLGIEEEL
jgi:hypothetical protein